MHRLVGRMHHLAACRPTAFKASGQLLDATFKPLSTRAAINPPLSLTAVGSDVLPGPRDISAMILCTATYMSVSTHYSVCTLSPAYNGFVTRVDMLTALG